MSLCNIINAESDGDGGQLCITLMLPRGKQVEGGGWAVVPIPQKGVFSLFIMYIGINLISYRRMHENAGGFSWL